jgi:hypothetical protein
MGTIQFIKALTRRYEMFVGLFMTSRRYRKKDSRNIFFFTSKCGTLTGSGCQSVASMQLDRDNAALIKIVYPNSAATQLESAIDTLKSIAEEPSTLLLTS